MKNFTITYKRQLFPWSEPYETTRDISAKDKWEAAEIAAEYAEKNTKMAKRQGGGETFVGKMTILSIK